MNARATTVATVWLVAGGSAVWWALLLRAQAPALPAPAVGQHAAAARQADWSRLFGNDAPAAAVAASLPVQAAPALRLDGVVAAPRHGLALIAVAGRPAQVFAVGAAVHGDLVVRSVSTSGVVLAHRTGGQPLLLPLAKAGAASAGAGQAGPLVASAVDDAQDTSPVVPPHADMRAPTARQAAAPGSDWARMRANPPAAPDTDGTTTAPASADVASTT